MLIDDGTGQGFRAKVTSDNELEVSAVQVPEIVKGSQNGRAFMTYGKHTQQVNGANEPLLFIQNESTDKDVHIERILLSTDSAGPAKIEGFWMTSGNGLGVDRVPQNMNGASSLASDLSVQDNNNNALVVTGESDATEFVDVRVGTGGGSESLNYQGALILSPGDGMSLLAALPNAGENVRASLYYYEEPVS